MGSADKSSSNGLPEGFIAIRGRISETVTLPSGKVVLAPWIEQKILSEMPALSHCMVVERPDKEYLSALLCLRVRIDEGVARNVLHPKALATSKGLGSKARTTNDARTCRIWKEYIDAGMARVNHAIESYTKPLQKWRLLTTDFTEKGGELTPTQKIRRKPTLAKHAEVVRSIVE